MIPMCERSLPSAGARENNSHPIDRQRNSPKIVPHTSATRKNMLGPLDPSTLSPPAQKMLQAPPKMQEMVARGIAPGIRPGELVVLLVAMSSSETEAVRNTAQKTLGALP